MEGVTLSLAIVVVAVALFDFTNGFHDAADMVATAIASRSMRPTVAITIVCLATFVAPFTVGLAVADTIGTFVDLGAVTPLQGEGVVVSGLVAAISYNLTTWVFGYPSSSSTSLAGGLVGAGLVAAGSEHIRWGLSELMNGQLDGVMKVIAGIFASPILGLFVGFVLMKFLLTVLRRFRHRVRTLFIWSQYVSVAGLGFSHGANDGQKGMAIIGMMLLADGSTSTFTVPTWALILCASAITLGTAFGGWRIIRTLGFGLYRVRTLHSVADQTGAGVVNGLATAIGMPTSTTQVVTATLLGVGAAERPGHVKWGKAAQIVAGWWLNLPVSIGLGWAYCHIYLLLRS